MRLEKEINIYAKDAILKRFKANETAVSVVQGKISAMISESELEELQSGNTTMYTKLANAVMEISSLKIDFSDMYTKYDIVSDQYSEIDSKVAEYKLSLDEFSADLTSVQQTLQNDYSTTETMNAVIETKVNEINLSVSSTYATQAAFNEEVGKIINLETWKSEASQKITDSAIISTVTQSTQYQNDLSGKVDESELASKIEQWYNSITIAAAKLQLEGYTTINGDFSVDLNGSMVATGGTIGGWIITESLLRSPDGKISLDALNNKIFTATDESGTWTSIEPGKIQTGIFTASTCTIGNYSSYVEISDLIDGGSSKISIASKFYVDNEHVKLYNLSHVSSGGHIVFGSDGETLAYLSSSSRRYKDHIRNMEFKEVEQLYNIPVVWFSYIDGYLDPRDRNVGVPIPGFYAEDMDMYIPSATVYNQEGFPEDWNYRTLLPVMVKALQEQKIGIENLKTENRNLWRTISELTA